MYCKNFTPRRSLTRLTVGKSPSLQPMPSLCQMSPLLPQACKPRVSKDATPAKTFQASIQGGYPLLVHFLIYLIAPSCNCQLQRVNSLPSIVLYTQGLRDVNIGQWMAVATRQLQVIEFVRLSQQRILKVEAQSKFWAKREHTRTHARMHTHTHASPPTQTNTSFCEKIE